MKVNGVGRESDERILRLRILELDQKYSDSSEIRFLPHRR